MHLQVEKQSIGVELINHSIKKITSISIKNANINSIKNLSLHKQNYNFFLILPINARMKYFLTIVLKQDINESEKNHTTVARLVVL